MQVLEGQVMPSSSIVIQLFTVFILGKSTAYHSSDILPSQIHLSLADDPSNMMVSWITKNDSDETFVEYGIGESPGEPSLLTEGTRFSFLSGWTEYSRRTSHRVLLHQLHPDTRYWYRCGGPTIGWSTTFTFKTFPTGESWQPNVAIMGDMGTVNAQILPLLKSMAASENFQLVVHVGDIAYNMETLNGQVGDSFFKNIEEVAARIPYMISPGNHDAFGNFTNVKNRFAMPGQYDNFYYTFKMGPILFISISTELYQPLEYGTPSQVSAQYRWLEEVLMKANQNREDNPWIIVYGHRPMYCNDMVFMTCLQNNEPVRVGSTKDKTIGLENLLYKYGVDLAFWGHTHVYERTLPVYNNKIFSGSSEDPYRNPRATVHYIVGCAGSAEGKHTFRPRPLQWSAFRSRNYGFSILKTVNNTHLHVQYIDKENNGKILDDVWIVQDQHGTFENRHNK